MAIHKPKYIFIPVDTLIHVEHTHTHIHTHKHTYTLKRNSHGHVILSNIT